MLRSYRPMIDRYMQIELAVCVKTPAKDSCGGMRIGKEQRDKEKREKRSKTRERQINRKEDRKKEKKARK